MKMTRNSGFTLVELMVTLSVVAVLLSAGVPSFSAMVKNNRLVSESDELRALLSAARFEAKLQRTTVTVCRSTDAIECSPGDWGAGYMAFIDLDGDARLDDDERLLEHRSKSTRGIGVSYSRAGGILRFDGNGYAADSSGTFTFCDERGAAQARELMVSVVGVAREAVGSKTDYSASILQSHAGKSTGRQQNDA
jgi:type IV fimbrial biogenesis protein FimT